MSKYTTEVRNICQAYNDLEEPEDYSDIDTVIDTALPKIFDFTFPIFDEAYRTTLEKKIVLHFYTREIGFETVSLWKLKLRTKLNEIMPFYNKLYQSELMAINPLWNVDFTTTLYEANAGTSQGTDTTTGSDNLVHSGTNSHTENFNQWDKYSDTPQGSIRNMNGNPATIETADDEYLTNARNISNNTSYSGSDGYTDTKSDTRTSNNSVNTSGTRNYTKTEQGYRGGKSRIELITQYRKALLNIDMMVINDLEPLFLHLWN